jgi:hypothetical protein
MDLFYKLYYYSQEETTYPKFLVKLTIANAHTTK